MNTLMGLVFREEMEESLNEYLVKKDVVRSRLYTEIFKFIPVNRFSYL